MDDIDHSLADVGDHQIAYVETGEGVPLILHHGGESHKRQYDMFMPLLSPDIRAISYDQRDVGDAATASAPYEVGDLADDCIGLMDALGLDRAHVMGISFGGAIALHVGLRHPDRVASLIVGAAPDTFGRPNPFIEQALGLDPEAAWCTHARCESLARGPAGRDHDGDVARAHDGPCDRSWFAPERSDQEP